MGEMMRRILIIVSLALTTLALGACGSRPVEALSSAEKAMADADLAKRCAPDEFLAAQKLLEKAKKLADEGEHARAKAVALAAEKKAKEAVAKAQARKEECLRPEQADQEVELSDQDDQDTSTSDDQLAGGLQPIYFDYNQPALTNEAKGILDSNAQWLLNNADVSIMVEGHCDERGSTEYNLALGEKRAKVTRAYLVRRGVNKDRMGLVSYGEERPADYGANADAHKRNRRAEFRRAQQ